MIESIPPGMILILGALLIPLLQRLHPYASRIWMLLLPILGMWQMWSLGDNYTLPFDAFGYPMELIRVDRLSRIFGTIFHIAAFLSVIYAIHVKKAYEHVSALMYAGAAIACVFAGDLITLFLFWELTAITSVFLIWARGTDRAHKAGMRYLIIQVASGVLLLAGTIIHYANTGSLAFEHLAGGEGLPSIFDAGIGIQLIFLAFGIKAAFPLLHTWMEDAYPEATVTGTVWLSAFTTKLAIYSLARSFAGVDILIPIGATMTAFPIFFAVIENDLRRVLAYSLNNQLGYMVVGIGIGTELAINGTAAHAFAHILYKGLLFMSMGAVLHRVGTVNGSELGGLYKSMPFTTVLCSIGAASISAFPLFSGFVSKSMILSAAAEGHYTVTFLILLFASAGVFHHSGIKIPYFAFFAHDSGRKVKEAPLNMLIAMSLAAALCIGLGVFYRPLYNLLPFVEAAANYNPYDVTHVVTQLQLLLYSAAAFIFLQKTGLYPPELKSVNIDSDILYRKALPALVRGTARVGGELMRGFSAVARGIFHLTLDLLQKHHNPDGSALGNPWPTGLTVAWAAILIVVYLMLAYL